MTYGSPSGGIWTEKFLTLTLPHSGDISRDVAAMPKGWRIFWKLLRQHLQLDRGLTKAQVAQLVYVRVIEITTGSKKDGHVHMHVYLITPYLHRALLQVLWARAIEACGYELNARSKPTPLAEVLAQQMEEWRRAELQRLLVTRRNGEPLAEVPNPVLDIRQCYSGVEEEIIKYLVKDAERDKSGVLVFNEDFLARVYEGTEGARMVQTSRGFWVPMNVKHCACAKCGGTKVSRRVHKAVPSDDMEPAMSLMDLPPERWKLDT